MRSVLAALSLGFILVAQAAAQPQAPAPQPSCEDLRDQATLMEGQARAQEGQAKSELAQARFALRNMTRERDEANKAVAEMKKQAGSTAPQPAAAPK